MKVIPIQSCEQCRRGENEMHEICPKLMYSGASDYNIKSYTRSVRPNCPLLDLPDELFPNVPPLAEPLPHSKDFYDSQARSIANRFGVRETSFLEGLRKAMETGLLVRPVFNGISAQIEGKQIEVVEVE